MTFATSKTEIIYRAVFVKHDGSQFHSAFDGKPNALSGIARRFAGGLYAKAVLTKCSRPRNAWGSEKVLETETFEPTQRAA